MTAIFRQAKETADVSHVAGNVRRAELKRWNCLDVDGIIIGNLHAESPSMAIQLLIGLYRNNPGRFRRPVCTLVSGGTRINVENVVGLAVSCDDTIAEFQDSSDN